MKKVFSNHSEVCHVWASQSQHEGRAGNISFIDNKLYSFHWFVIGNIINKKTVLIYNDFYSTSTSKHVGYAIIAVNHLNIIYVSSPDNILGSLGGLVNKLQQTYNKFPKARENKENLFNENCRIINNINELLTATRKKHLLKQKYINGQYTFKTLIKKYTLPESSKDIIEAEKNKREAARKKRLKKYRDLMAALLLKKQA